MIQAEKDLKNNCPLSIENLGKLPESVEKKDATLKALTKKTRQKETGLSLAIIMRKKNNQIKKILWLLKKEFFA